MSKLQAKALAGASMMLGVMDAMPQPGSETVLYFGVRQRGPAADVIGAVRWAGEELEVVYGLGTTEPTGYWLRNPMREAGAFVLADGIHRRFFSKGLHRGQYPAMRQHGVAIGWRDGDRDSDVDYGGLINATGTGINLHHGTGERASAGCQVLYNSALRAAIVEWAEPGKLYDYLLIDIDSRPSLRESMVTAFPELGLTDKGEKA